jgi:hypothetical protein
VPAHIDLTSKKFTRLLVKEKVGKTQSGQYKYKCLCDCGNIIIVAGGYLKSGHTKSCGCYSRDMARTRLYKHGRSDKSRQDYYDYHREIHIKRKYGLSMDEYNSMIEAQDGKCAICNYMFGQKKGDIHVDHCHTSNEIRGLLCDLCNRGLGYFKDNKEALAKAIKYLTKE